MTFSILTLSITMTFHYAECYILFSIILNVIVLNVIMLSIIWSVSFGTLVGACNPVTGPLIIFCK
jgi:hypothetical protein